MMNDPNQILEQTSPRTYFEKSFSVSFVASQHLQNIKYKFCLRFFIASEFSVSCEKKDDCGLQ